LSGRWWTRPRSGPSTNSETFPTTSYGIAHNLDPALAAKIKEAFFTFPWEGSALKAEFKTEDRFVPITYQKDWSVIRKDRCGDRRQIHLQVRPGVQTNASEWIAAGHRHARGGSRAVRRGQRAGDARAAHSTRAYCDRNGDLTADLPTDPKKVINPSTLIFSYTPVEDPPFIKRCGTDSSRTWRRPPKKVAFFPVQSNAAQYEAMRSGRLHVAASMPVAMRSR